MCTVNSINLSGKTPKHESRKFTKPTRKRRFIVFEFGISDNLGYDYTTT